MDVLRGIALFGVFLVNFVGFASAPIMSTEHQLLSLDSAAVDFTLAQLIEWLAVDKANTLFAFLFGLGFYLQMQRLECRGVDFESFYKRRLTVLLVIGVVHFFFLWTWDILHLYALAGFLLLAMRRLGNRALLIAGIALAALGRTVQKVASEFGAPVTGGVSTGYGDADIMLRQQISESGDYFGIVSNFFDWVFIDYIGTGLILGWLAYALGRFLIGAWVGRKEWITRSRDFMPGFRRTLRWTLPLGLILEGVAVLAGESPLLPEFEHREFLGQALHLAAVPVLAAGYVCAVVVGFQTRWGSRLLAPFGWSGRMALTNYLTQSLVIGFVLFGVGPGLALAGRIGTTAICGIVIVFYVAQMLFSRWWLGRYRYGPMEWLWRRLSYGEDRFI